MAVTRDSLVGSVRLLCGEPPDLPLPQGLPTNLVFEELLNIEAQMLRDLDLSILNRRVGKADIPLTGLDSFSLSSADFHAPAYIYLQIDSSDIWYPVEIVSQSSLVQAGIDGRLAVAFSGVPQVGYLSWIPESPQVLRVWYERGLSDDPALGDSSEIGSLYDEYLKLQTAAQCREYLKLEIGAILASRLMKSEKQWQRYANRGRQQGQGYKNPVWQPRRFRRSFVDRGRFFVS